MLIKRRIFCDVFRTSNSLKMTLTTVTFLFLFACTGAHDNQLKGPENTLSVIGSTVTLNCSSPARNCSKFEWQKSGSDSSSPMNVFKEPNGILTPFRDRYSVDNASGCDLVIKNVQLTDAGRFSCKTVISGSVPSKTANLIVLKTPPNCTTNASKDNTLDKDQVKLSCEVTYNATSKASMIWKEAANASAAVENGNTISRSYSFAASAPEIPPYTCETSFPVDTSIAGIALNIPNTSCVTTVIKVLYSVREVTLSPSSSYYSPGTSITCTAKGHPPPTFKWQELHNNGSWVDVQDGDRFMRHEASSNQFRCVAMNAVKGRNETSASSEFKINNTGSGNNTDASSTSGSTTTTGFPLIALAGVGAGVGVLLLLIIVVVCFCTPCCPGYKCCHTDKSKEKIREQYLLNENPDIYSNIDDATRGPPKAKPRAPPANDPPKKPKGAAPQAKPRTDLPKANNVPDYQHEEVTYAELASDVGPRHVPKYNEVPQETVYAAVGTA